MIQLDLVASMHMLDVYNEGTECTEWKCECVACQSLRNQSPILVTPEKAEFQAKMSIGLGSYTKVGNRMLKVKNDTTTE
jgi:hypothetical protein